MCCCRQRESPLTQEILDDRLFLKRVFSAAIGFHAAEEQYALALREQLDTIWAAHAQNRLEGLTAVIVTAFRVDAMDITIAVHCAAPIQHALRAADLLRPTDVHSYASNVKVSSLLHSVGPASS